MEMRVRIYKEASLDFFVVHTQLDSEGRPHSFNDNFDENDDLDEYEHLIYEWNLSL